MVSGILKNGVECLEKKCNIPSNLPQYPEIKKDDADE